MKGVIEPSVSAGSSHRGARVKCTAHVIWPAGAGPPDWADPTAASHVCSTMTTSRPMSRDMSGPSRANREPDDIIPALTPQDGKERGGHEDIPALHRQGRAVSYRTDRSGANPLVDQGARDDADLVPGESGR